LSDLLLVNGRVHTMDPAAPFAPAVAIRGNRILAVGTTERLETMAGAGARVIDLRGRVVLPGFVDAHVHFLNYARALQQVSLDGLTAVEPAVALVAERLRRVQPGDWLEGRGWNRNLWPNAAFPTRATLDAVAPDTPVALQSKDGHALWVNTAALSAAGVSAATPDPNGGQILRDERGEPTGVLLENAQALVMQAVPRPSRQRLLSNLFGAVSLAQRLGVSGIHDLEGADALWCFQQLELEGKLGLRVSMGIPREHLASAEQLGLRTGLGGERLRIGLVKLFADGALGSRTAFMLAPYEGEPEYRGLPTIEPSELEEDIARARQAGLGVAVHAIGDAAVRATLDAMERVQVRLPPDGQIMRIEHAQCVDPDDVPRFASLGVVASMQPIHATSDMQMADAHWGRRAANAYAWRTLADAGAQLAFGTDAPVEELDPLKSLYAAVTRRRGDGTPPEGWYPEQKLSLVEAVRAYTLGSAAAAGMADLHGSISPGKAADLNVLSLDVFKLPAEALLETRVDMAVFDGRVIFGE
jgi:predicted amidohydrolase YtcJ